MAPPKKPPSRRQRRGTKDLAPEPAAAVAPVVADAEAPAPKPPTPAKEWLAVTKSDWQDFWASDMAAFVKATDRPALKRLFVMRDQHERAQREEVRLRKMALAEPIVLGSMGQKVANPMFRAADSAAQTALALEARIVALEDRFGMTPKARLAIGVAEQTGRNLAGQNELLANRLMETLGAPDPRSS